MRGNGRPTEGLNRTSVGLKRGKTFQSESHVGRLNRTSVGLKLLAYNTVAEAISEASIEPAWD